MGVDLHHHGDAEVTPGLHDFAVNVLVPAPPEWLRSLLVSAVADLARYPDVTAAREAVAAHHGVSADQVLLTNGAAEAFTLLALARPWRRPVVVHPQFTEPEAALVAAGRPVTRVILDGATGFALETNRVPVDADLVVVGNPTNPTGVVHPRAALTRLRRPGRVVVVDEAFLDVVGGEESLAGTAGVAVVRSLTKSFGLAGLRVGYLVADPDLVRACRRHQPPWSVSSLAAAVVPACLGPLGSAHRVDLRAVLPTRRARLDAVLERHGFATVAGGAPFVLASHPNGLQLREALRENGFAVRRGDTFPGLDPTWLRFAVRDETTLDLLDTALDTVCPDPHLAPATSGAAR